MMNSPGRSPVEVPNESAGSNKIQDFAPVKINPAMIGATRAGVLGAAKSGTRYGRRDWLKIVAAFYLLCAIGCAFASYLLPHRIRLAAVLAAAGLCVVGPVKVAAQNVNDLYRITGGVTQSRTQFQQISVPQGGEYELADFRGPGKITYFYITDDTGGQWYRGLVLEIFWDGETKPSVAVPLADFFGFLDVCNG